MIMNRLALFAILMIYYFPRDVELTKTYHHWQCSLPEEENIFSLFHQNFEAFHAVKRPEWLMKKRKYISCHRKGLNRIPQDLDKDIEILNLDKNLITRVGKNDFAPYSSLVALSIVSNCIQISFYDSTIRRCLTEFSVEPGTFSSLTNLRYLSLTGNIMKQFPVMLPKSLSVLFTSYSSLGPLQPLRELTSLQIVSFSSNCITADLKNLCRNNFSVENLAFKSPSLKFLDLAYNNLKKVPGDLFQQSLVGIKLRGNPLDRIHSQDFINSTNLIFLSLAWTAQYIQRPLHIERGTFNHLSKLRFLDLSGNMISNLTKDLLINNTKLKALNLEFNCLKNIEIDPVILPPLPLLEELHLSGNRLCTDNIYPLKHIVPKLELTDAYRHFPKLKILVLGTTDDIPSAVFGSSIFFKYFQHGTKYDEVNKDSFNVLKSLPRLKILALAVCGIRVLETSGFSGLNLTYLDLQRNQIGEPHNTVYNQRLAKRAVRKPTFYDYSELKLRRRSLVKTNPSNEASVNFSGNAISDLKHYPMKYIRFVTHLSLSNNHINYIDETTFHSLAELKVLDLRNNPIRQIHPNAFLSLSKLSDLRIVITIPQRDIKLDFLSNVQNDLIFKYGDWGSNFYLLLKNYGRNSTYFMKIVTLDVSGVRVPSYYISRNQAIYQPLPNLRYLTLNNAQLTYQPQSNFFLGVEKLITLSMRDCLLEQFPSHALKRLQNLAYLDLSHNRIEVMDKDMVLYVSHIKSLILSYNFIHRISPGLLQDLHGQGLHHIDLSHNQIRHIDPSIIDRQLLDGVSYLDLRGNTINCVCSLGNTFGYLVSSSKLNHSRLPGFFPDCSTATVNYYGGCIACAKSHSVLSYPPSLFTYSVTHNCHETFFLKLCVFFSTITLFFLLVPLITTNSFVKRKLTNFLLRDIRLHYFKEQEDVDLISSFYAYDGFIYYDKTDFTVGDWVDQIMVPKLEMGNPSFRICVVGEEDWCGTTQVQQLLLRMRASRKTIVILSKNFLSTPQCQYVLSVLEEWLYVNKEDKGIIVAYKEFNPEIVTHFQRRKRINCSLLHYSTLEENPLFWQTLKSAMITLF